MLPTCAKLLLLAQSKLTRMWRETSVALVRIRIVLNAWGRAAAGLMPTSRGAISSSAKSELGTAERGAVWLPSFVWCESFSLSTGPITFPLGNGFLPAMRRAKNIEEAVNPSQSLSDVPLPYPHLCAKESFHLESYFDTWRFYKDYNLLR